MDEETDFSQEYAAFGRRVRFWRKRKGWTIETLGHEAGKDPSWVARVERGESNVTLRTILTLALALEVRPTLLLEDEVES